MNADGKIDEKANIIFTSKPIPQQGFSVSKRISPELQAKIRDALMSEDGHNATLPARKRFGGSRPLMVTSREEYQGYYRFLQDFWGFEVPEIAEPEAVEPADVQAAPASTVAGSENK
jgi:hypothetical protein